jgi:hypothetical protein
MSEEEIKVVRKESCPSLSGSSTISYEIGSKGDCQYIRLAGNSAGGIFCKNWISMVDIQQLLLGISSVTSKTFQSVYVGKSSNSPGFIAACVINEKLANRKETIPVKKVSTKTAKAAPVTTPQKKASKGKSKNTPPEQNEGS